MIVLSRRAVILKAPEHLDILKSHLYKTDFMNWNWIHLMEEIPVVQVVRALLNVFAFNNRNQPFLCCCNLVCAGR